MRLLLAGIIALAATVTAHAQPKNALDSVRWSLGVEGLEVEAPAKVQAQAQKPAVKVVVLPEEISHVLNKMGL